MKELPPLRRTSLVDQMAEMLEQRILSGELKPGDRLPSEATLAEEFGASRPQLREALASLRERGYLETINGRGTTVQVPDWDSVARTVERQVLLARGSDLAVEHIYETRRLIEVRCVELAAARISDAELVELEQRLIALDNDRDDRVRYADGDVGFHLAIAAASQNPMLAGMLRGMLRVLIQTVAETHGSSQVEVGMRGHWRILQALRDRDPADAVIAMRDHLEHSRSFLLAALGGNSA